MTTIAYKDGIVAYDSILTQGNVICDNNYDKRLDRNGAKFFFSGAASLNEYMIDAYFGEKVIEKLAGRAIVVDNGIFTIGVDEDDFWKFKERGVCAIGSGECYALAAMDAGATAKEAVKIAIGRDIYSGGRIRTFKVQASCTNK